MALDSTEQERFEELKKKGNEGSLSNAEVDELNKLEAKAHNGEASTEATPENPETPAK